MADLRLMDPDARRALAALATLPRNAVLGRWRRQDGTWGDPVTINDCREAILNGTVDPHTMLQNVALVRWALSDQPPEALPYYMRDAQRGGGPFESAKTPRSG